MVVYQGAILNYGCIAVAIKSPLRVLADGRSAEMGYRALASLLMGLPKCRINAFVLAFVSICVSILGISRDGLSGISIVIDGSTKVPHQCP